MAPFFPIDRSRLEPVGKPDIDTKARTITWDFKDKKSSLNILFVVRY